MVKRSIFLSLLLLILLFSMAWAQGNYQKFVHEPARKTSYIQSFWDKITSPKPFDASYAIVIAIGDYDNIPTLESVSKDAAKMKNYLLYTGEYDEVVVLQDSDASFENIRYFMKSYFPKKMARNGRYRFMFYFSGHGTQQKGYDDKTIGYLQLKGARGGIGDAESISMKQIETWSDDLRASHLLFLLDCCFSGLAGTEVKNYDTTVDPADLAKENGRFMITAGGENESSIGSISKWDGSLFTDVVITGMKGAADIINGNNDGVVTTYELFTYTQAAVKNEAKKARKKQNPLINNLGSYKDTGQYFFVYKDLNPPPPPKPEPIVEIEQKGKEEIEETIDEDFTDAKSDIDFVFVKGGTFDMGSEDGQSDEKPVRSVTVRDFYIGKYEVTVAQFKKFVDETGYKTDAEKGDGSYIFTGRTWEKKSGVTWKCDVNGNVRPQSEYNHPVIHVSWNDAKAFCDHYSYVLPTEAQWEYAARGGSQSKGYTYSGSNNPADVAWYSRNSGRKTRQVGTKQKNELGIYDMSGNVWEWCNDWYGNYPKEAQINPTGPKAGRSRVLRGGSWYDSGDFIRVTNRLNGYFPDDRSDVAGFRISRWISK